MPHAALWVVQLCSQISSSVSATCFNAARGFVGGAASRSLLGFWVHTSFNAARGFVGGATLSMRPPTPSMCSFNAARGFVGGAA